MLYQIFPFLYFKFPAMPLPIGSPDKLVGAKSAFFTRGEKDPSRAQDILVEQAQLSLAYALQLAQDSHVLNNYALGSASLLGLGIGALIEHVGGIPRIKTPEEITIHEKFINRRGIAELAGAYAVNKILEDGRAALNDDTIQLPQATGLQAFSSAYKLAENAGLLDMKSTWERLNEIYIAAIALSEPEPLVE